MEDTIGIYTRGSVVNNYSTVIITFHSILIQGRQDGEAIFDNLI